MLLLHGPNGKSRLALKGWMDGMDNSIVEDVLRTADVVS